MNDYSKLDEIFQFYKENENLIFIKIINDGNGVIVNKVKIAIINKNTLRKNKNTRNAEYTTTISFKEKKKYNVLYYEMLSYIKHTYKIENINLTNYNSELIYASEEMFKKLIKISPASNVDINEPVIFLYFTFFCSDGIEKLFFTVPLPYNKINYWLRYNIDSADSKMNILKKLYKKYDKNISVAQEKKKKADEELHRAENCKTTFLSFLDDEQKLLLEINSGE